MKNKDNLLKLERARHFEEVAALRLAADCFRLANDQLNDENARLRAGLELVRLDNGYGFDVPEDYGDDFAWVIRAGTVRKLAAIVSKKKSGAS